MTPRYLLLLLNDAGVPCAWLSAPSVNTLCAWLPGRCIGNERLGQQLVTALHDIALVPTEGRYYLGRFQEQEAFLLAEEGV